MSENDIDARVVASPLRELLDLRVVEWEAGRCVVRIPPDERLGNFAGNISGAVIGAAIDVAGVLAGCFTPEPEPPRTAVTLDYTVVFVTAGSCREPGFATGTVLGGGNRIFMSTVEVRGAGGAILASGHCTCRYVK